MTNLNPLPIPPEIKSTEKLTAWVDGHSADLLDTGTGPALMLKTWGGYSVKLLRPEGWEGLRVAPARARARCEIHLDELILHCPEPGSLLLEVNGSPVAYVLVIPPGGHPPEPKHGGRLLHFPAGDVTEVGSLSLKSGDVLWVAEGAAIRGQIIASESEDIVIGGGGILDASLPGPDGETLRPVILDNCRRVSLGNLTIINGRHWMVSIGRCEDVVIEATRQFSNRNGTDGIDIVGSRRVTVRGCFLRNGDDNIAIKALDVKSGFGVGQSCPGEYKGNWESDVSDILVEGCAFYKDHGGSAMEIGYETRAARIGNITFRDIDVMAVHQFGSVFGIHNGDRASVENVVWENIRVEHHFDKLVDFRVLHSRWNTDPERGQIRNVVLRNIDVAESPYNPGYTVSLIGGFDVHHRVDDVRFENFQLGGRKVSCADDLSLFTRHASVITFH